MWIWIVIVGIVVIIAIAFIGMYNGLIRLRNQVKNAWAQIDVQLKRRYDLVPNLVETVKGYASHERETLQSVTEARQQVVKAEGLPAKLAANQQLTGALTRLLAVVERYPDLKASQNFRMLQDQLEGTENRISVARTRYNEAVRAYNTAIRSFPTLVMAKLLGFDSREPFQAPEGADQAPKVKF
jgi:LemA protein